MTAVFADTSFYVALASPRDALHARAQEQAERHAAAVVTTVYVLLETANFLCRSPDRAVFVALIEALDADPQTTIVVGSHERFVAGCVRYRDRPDKDWSLTDCLSFLTMQELGLTDALTADHHFEQAGFRAMLR
ncbi:MAG: type II toxin-antitoxin system VapC family toxin [Planctomycetaceae bacterium]